MDECWLKNGDSVDANNPKKVNDKVNKELESDSLSVKDDKKFNFRNRLRNGGKNEKVQKRLNMENDLDTDDTNDFSASTIKRMRRQLTNESLENGDSKQSFVEMPKLNSNLLKTIIYNHNDFLAVRNEANSFFLCRAKQKIYKNSKKIRIQWYNNDENPEVYYPDFCDNIEFECILTNIRIIRADKSGVKVPIMEKNRALNILERALNVEKVFFKNKCNTFFNLNFL